MSDTGKMLLTTVMTVELFRMVISHLTLGQSHRLTWVCKEFYAYKMEIPSVQDWIRDMYRRYIMDMELSVKSEDGKEVLYYHKDSGTVLKVSKDFYTHLFNMIPGTLLCRVNIMMQHTWYNSGIGTPEITDCTTNNRQVRMFFCDPANPTVPDFRFLHEVLPDMRIELEKSYSSSEEFHSNYLNHISFLYPLIEKDPIQIPANTIKVGGGREI